MQVRDLKSRLKLGNIFKGHGISRQVYDRFIRGDRLDPKEKAVIEDAIHSEAKKILGFSFKGKK